MTFYFFIKAFQQPSSHFNINHYITFSHANTRSSSTNKLHHVHTNNNCFCNFYFNRLPRLWNSLPPIDLTKSLSSIKTTIYNYLWNHFKQNFLSTNPCTFHYCCRCTNCYNQGLIFNSITNFLAVSTGCWQTINATVFNSNNQPIYCM